MFAAIAIDRNGLKKNNERECDCGGHIAHIACRLATTTNKG